MVEKFNFFLQSRLDIGFMVNNVSQFCMHPQKPHLDVVKHIYWFVIGTIDMGLLYQQGEDCLLSKFSNVDWANDRDDKRSTTGYTFLLGSTSIFMCCNFIDRKLVHGTIKLCQRRCLVAKIVDKVESYQKHKTNDHFLWQSKHNQTFWQSYFPCKN